MMWYFDSEWDSQIYNHYLNVRLISFKNYGYQFNWRYYLIDKGEILWWYISYGLIFTTANHPVLNQALKDQVDKIARRCSDDIHQLIVKLIEHRRFGTLSMMMVHWVAIKINTISVDQTRNNLLHSMHYHDTFRTVMVVISVVPSFAICWWPLPSPGVYAIADRR